MLAVDGDLLVIFAFFEGFSSGSAFLIVELTVAILVESLQDRFPIGTIAETEAFFVAGLGLAGRPFALASLYRLATGSQFLRIQFPIAILIKAFAELLAHFRAWSGAFVGLESTFAEWSRSSLRVTDLQRHRQTGQ